MMSIGGTTKHNGIVPNVATELGRNKPKERGRDSKPRWKRFRVPLPLLRGNLLPTKARPPPRLTPDSGTRTTLKPPPKTTDGNPARLGNGPPKEGLRDGGAAAKYREDKSSGSNSAPRNRLQKRSGTTIGDLFPHRMKYWPQRAREKDPAQAVRAKEKARMSQGLMLATENPVPLKLPHLQNPRSFRLLLRVSHPAIIAKRQVRLQVATSPKTMTTGPSTRRTSEVLGRVPNTAPGPNCSLQCRRLVLILWKSRCWMFA